MRKSIGSPAKHKPQKPEKPYPDFPLFPHATRRWAKKIKGKLYYFGPWDDPQGALDKYLAQKDALYAGRKPRPETAGCAIRELANAFLNSKRLLLETGDLTLRTWTDYKAATDLVVSTFGTDRLVEDLRPEDFEPLRAKLAKKWGPVTLGNTIQRIRMIFKYASDNGLIAKSVLYGQAFKRPSQKKIRAARNAKGLRMFEAQELRDILKAADLPLKAMILLGINCGFGNHDCGQLPLSAVDLERGWVNFPRPKTEVLRRCPLWPETTEAMRAALSKRPQPKDADAQGRFFITKYGSSWAKDIPDSPVAKEMAKLLKKLGLKRPGLNFYALRHTFETIAGETDRQAAVDHIMGHAPRSDDMSAVYRERIGDGRLRAVTDFVRNWLFATEGGPMVVPFQAKAN